MPRLEMLDPDFPGDYELRQGTTTIGRRPENDIVLSGTTVSGRHAEIEQTKEGFVLTDVGSRNGTHVNMTKIDTPTALRHNDEIHFGNMLARFLHPPSAKTVHGGRGTVRGGGTVVMDEGSSAALSDLSDARLMTDDRDSKIGTSLNVGQGFGVLQADTDKKLKAVLEISKRLAGTHDVDSILPIILKSLLDLFSFADRGFVLIREAHDGELRPHAMLHRREGGDATIRLSRTIINRVLEEKTAIVSDDAVHDDQFLDSESIVDLRIRSIMCVPMMSLKGEAIGIISLDSQNQLGKFSSDDLELLVAVAGQAALAYENVRLVQSYIEKEKQDVELDIARSVQRALLPAHLPDVGDYSFFAYYDSANAVGGDYYDLIQMDGGGVCVSLGDVAGKGVPGALVMSRMHSCVQSTMQHVTEASRALDSINEHMCRNGVDGRFVSFVLGLLDPLHHRLTVANAGHPSPVIRRMDGTIEEFNDACFGPPVGVDPACRFESESKELLPGDVVVLVTDGVDEAMNEQGLQYGKVRTLDVIRRSKPDPQQIVEGILADVRLHAGGFPQSDDITIFAFGRRPQQYSGTVEIDTP